MNSTENITCRRLAIFFIIIGMLFAADSIFRLSVVYKFWPLIVMTLGIGFVGIFIKRRAHGALYLGLGEYLIGFSGLALYCNFTSWRYITQIWPFFIVFLGIVFLSLFIVHRRSRFILFIGFLLLSLSLYFFLVFLSGSQFWWTIFILVGVSILIAERVK